MVEKDEHITFEELLIRKLSGNAGSEDVKLLDQWMQSSEENRETARRIEELWGLTGSIKGLPTVDVDHEWNMLASKLGFEDNTRRLWTGRSLFIRIAAMFLVVLSVALATFFMNSSRKSAEFLTAATLDSLQLPDGTRVTLNRESSIRYPKELRANEARKVKLEGEARFEVRHDSTRPFVVEASGILVEVLGTVFTVNAYENSSRVDVAVESGTVKVTSEKNLFSPVILSKGEGATFSKKEKSITKNEVKDENINSWITKKLVFRKSKMQQVVKTLNKAYGVSIVIQAETIKNCRLSATFEGQELDDILLIIENTLDITITRKNGQYILTGKGC